MERCFLLWWCGLLWFVFGGVDNGRGGCGGGGVCEGWGGRRGYVGLQFEPDCVSSVACVRPCRAAGVIIFP